MAAHGAPGYAIGPWASAVICPEPSVANSEALLVCRGRAGSFTRATHEWPLVARKALSELTHLQLCDWS